jgi:hypothetical protein
MTARYIVGTFDRAGPAEEHRCETFAQLLWWVMYTAYMGTLAYAWDLEHCDDGCNGFERGERDVDVDLWASIGTHCRRRALLGRLKREVAGE